MGIDQSFTSSGIIILNNDDIIHSECFKTNKKANSFNRAHVITMRIKELIEEHNPDIIAIEGLAFGMRGNATRDLAGLQFVIVTYIQEVLFKEVDIISPLTVKKFATGSGNSKKEEMISHLPEEVLQLFLSTGVKKTTGLADLTDAYWIAKFIQVAKIPLPNSAC